MPLNSSVPSNVVTPLGDAPNSPQLGNDMQEHVPSIVDIGQALQLVRSLQAENREREKKNSRILERYNAERPWNPHQLKADGLAWKVNFTTRPLTTLIDKVVPRFVNAVDQMKYLTASQLPDRFQNADEKTEAFRREITETCRGHEQWHEFLCNIAQENSLFGYVGAGWLDEFTWFPRYYDQDSFLVPQGTRHAPKTATIVCFRDSYLVHQLFDMVRDFDAAGYAGWDVPNVVESINNAIPDDRRSYQTDYSRVYADLVRESAILSSFTGAKAVIVWHVFVTEVDGYVTHVAFDDRSGKQLFWKNKQFEKMADVSAFFTFQHGNGRIHGSKGIGRELYNMAQVLDRARNEAVDRLTLSGKLVIQCDEREIKRFRMSVVGNAILVASGYEIKESKIDGNVEAFFTLDKFLTALLNDIAGNVSPQPQQPEQQAERVTAKQVELQAGREEETKDVLIGRFLIHFARFMSTIQRRLCDPKTIEQDAKEMQARLLKIMDADELSYLANQPAVHMVKDYTDIERQQVVVIAQEGKGNPLYNQRELEKRKLTAAVSEEFAEAVLLPQNDPTEQAEQERQQLMENQILDSGQPLPVSPRDNDLIHLAVLQNTIDHIIPTAKGNVGAWVTMESLGNHMQAHIAAAENKGMQKQAAPYKLFVTKLATTLIKLHQTMQGQPGAHDKLATELGQPTIGGGNQESSSATPPPAAPAQPSVAYTPIHEAISIAYKDLPPDVQRQIEAKLGLTPSQLPSPSNPAAPAAPAAGAPPQT